MSEELKDKRNQDVLFIERDILYDPNLEPSDKYLYIILRMNMIKNKSYSTISYKTINSKSGLPHESISNSIKRLEMNHYIMVDHSPEGNKYYFRDSTERPITVFEELIKKNKAKMHYIAKLICILLHNHYGSYCINDLSSIIGRDPSKNTDKNNYLKIAIKNSKEHIKLYTLGKTVYYYYDHDLENEHFTASRGIKIPSNINEIRPDYGTKTDKIYSDAAITLYAYLCLLRKDTQNYAEYYDSYVIKSLHLTKSQFSNAIKKLEEKKLISVSGDSKLKKATFIPQKSYITIYSDILLNNTIMKNDDYYKAIAYYITHYNDTHIDSKSEVPALLKPFIEEKKFIDFSKMHHNDPRCSYNIESLIGTDLLADPCSPVGIAASMLRDAILHAKDNAEELYNILFSKKKIYFSTTLLYDFINQNYKQCYNITRFIYSVREKLSEYTTKTTPPKSELLNYSLYNNTLKLVIDVNNITDNMITATNCHNTAQKDLKIFFDTSSEHKIKCGKYIVTLKALLTSDGVYEYHLLSCKKYNNEPIYSIDHKLPDNNAILFFDENPVTLVPNAFSMRATGVALKNAFNLTVPFKASAFFIKTAGYEFNLESISSLSIELRGEYYNLVDGLNISCDDYKIYFSTQKDLKQFLKKRVELDPTIIKAIIPKWKDILSDGIISTDKLEAELKDAGVDGKTITNHLCLLEMTLPKVLMELLKEIAPFEEVVDNKKLQMYKMLYKAIYNDNECNNIHVIKTNPYILLQYYNRNLTISFQKIDDYAFKMGIENDNPIRLEGIIKYLIKYISLSGNVGIDYTSSDFYKFIKKVCYDPLCDEEEFIKKLKDQAKDSESIILNGDYISSQELYTAEEAIAKNIKRILDSSSTIKIENKDIEQYEKKTKKTLDKKQKDAIAAINDSNIVVIQGSAGTGKSYLVKCIIDLFTKKYSVNEYKILTPTGKAAQIYSDKNAATIHRYLGYSMDKGFSECRKTIPDKLIIIDEASMIDIITANALFAAIADGTKVILVGDKNQLPPVEPGRVFYDIISCEKIKTIELEKIYRTDSETIIYNATKVLQGKNEFKLAPSEFEIIYKKSNDEIINETKKRAQKLYESEDGNTKQIITTTNRTAATINKYVEEELLSSDDHEIDWWLENEASDYHIEWRGKKHYLYVGEAVIFQNNDKQKRYVNGQVGIVTAVDNTKKTVQISTDKKTTIELNYPELKNIQPAYAITIHKSQGSEYDEVLIAITDEAENLITRELLYTAITRAKKKVTIVASKDALITALNNTCKRTTFLTSFLNDTL